MLNYVRKRNALQSQKSPCELRDATAVVRQLSGKNFARGEKLLTYPLGLAPRVGFEPTTYRLTGEHSTAELPRNIL